MSSEALSWAFKQECKSSSVKFTLVAMCECANYRTGRITPSIDHIAEITGQNRKTIIVNIAELESQGLITDTGERVGRTKQIKVYSAAMGTVPNAEPSHKRNSTEKVGKQSQKRDTEPSLEPSCPSEATLPPDRPARPSRILEDWLPGSLPATVAALVAQWPPGRIERELEGFRDYWLTRPKDFRRENWDRVWWNRIRDIHDRVMRDNHGRSNQNFRPSQSGGPDRRSGLARAIDRELGEVSPFP